MKKVLIITLLIFTILISFLSTSFAAITVTETSLEESIKKFENSPNKVDNSSVILDKSTKQIKISVDSENYLINYDFSQQPKFSIDMNFNTSMTNEQARKQFEGLVSLISVFPFVADIAGIDYEDSLFYILSDVYSDTMPDDSLEYAQKLFESGTEDSIKKPYFTTTMKCISKSKDEYTIQAVLSINTNADFSKLAGYSDKLVSDIKNSITSSSQDTTNIHKNALEEENEKIDEFKGYVNSLSKLPQTGDYFDLKDGLYLICGISGTALIFIILKSIKYKNV